MKKWSSTVMIYIVIFERGHEVFDKGSQNDDLLHKCQL
jgi:hypothetical protein